MEGRIVGEGGHGSVRREDGDRRGYCIAAVALATAERVIGAFRGRHDFARYTDRARAEKEYRLAHPSLPPSTHTQTHMGGQGQI